MDRALPTRGDLSGQHFGKLTVICRSDKRGSRGARTVPLWECRCECGNTVYKATDSLTNPDLSMCSECAASYAAEHLPLICDLSSGMRIILLTVVLSSAAALLFPRKEADTP